MKKNLLISICLLAFSWATSARETIYRDADANRHLYGTKMLRYTDRSALPDYIQFAAGMEPGNGTLVSWMQNHLHLNLQYGLQELNRMTDELGMEHIRYVQTYQGVPVAGTMYIAHIRQGKIESLNGEVYNDLPAMNMQPGLTESQALQYALQKVHALQYKWEVAAEETGIKLSENNPAATWFPKAETMILKSGTQYHLCYAFNIYAQEPMGRTKEYVDAANGSIILSHNLIETVNVNGTAVTKYSGTQTFQTDSVSATSYRLHDVSRGNGIITYNLATGTNYTSATDFTDADNYWNNVNTAHDEAATDAHWGAQKTYDYYYNRFSRNSIDNAGYNLKSYVHYSTNYDNAFWDGTRMTYGDGNVANGFMIMTALDVCGHEITHGLTSYTANLGATSSGTAECDALNEGYSDVFGTSVERFARPSQWDWIIGADITCTAAGVPDGVGIRNMSNPAAFQQPSCYLGTNWDAAGEPHNNNGPLIYWFYLLTTGSAANNITALGHDTSERIAYRTLTVHLTPNATYNDARFYSIVSSTELYGGCSTATIATTNAWHTVCVGAAYVAGATASSFTGDVLQTCDTTLTVNFTNNSTNANTFSWSFGDGVTSTVYNPSHTYSSGVYTVKLIADGGTCGIDSMTQTAYIHVGPPPGPATVGATLCGPGSATLAATPSTSGDTIRWYTVPSGGTAIATGNSYTTPTLSTTTTYYAEETFSGPTYHVGPASNAIGAGANYNTTWRYEIFDCSAPCTLQTVLVYAQGAGNRTVVLRNAAGTTLQSITVNMPTGTSVVTLNMPIPVGTGLRLGIDSGTTINLYRNTAGASYPYTNGPISITGNTAGDPVRFYFFYDWVIKVGDCISQRTPTTVSVGSGSTPATITAPNGLSACSPGTVLLNANTGTGLTYQWYNGSTAIGGATASSYSASASGNYSVVVGGTPCPAGTSSPATVAINTAPPATVTAGGPTSFCVGGSVTLNANTGTGLSYQWYESGVAISGATNASYNTTQSGSYTVITTNTSSCSSTSAITTVTSNPLPNATVTVSGSTSFCTGGSVTLSASGGATYQWYNGASAISGATNASYTATQTGNYSVTIVSSANCSATSTAVAVSASTIPSPSVINTSGTLSVSGGPYTSYQWYLNGSLISGATNATYAATTNGAYYVVVTKDGCSGTSNTISILEGVTDVLAAGVVIAPNPAHNLIEITGAQPARITIRDMQGQMINEVYNRTSLTVEELANGMYFVLGYDEQGRLLFRQKFMKQ